MNKNSTLKDTLKLNNITYFFIEQTWDEVHEDNYYMPTREILIIKLNRGIESHRGTFEPEDARRCYKALLKNGFQRA